MNPLFMLTIYAKELLNSLFFYPDADAIAIAAASCVAWGSSPDCVLIRVRTAHMIVQLIVRIDFWFDLIWFKQLAFTRELFRHISVYFFT